MKKHAVLIFASLPALVLRSMLYRFALDEKGLLTPFHPLEICLWVLTAAYLLAVILYLRKQPEAETVVPVQNPSAAFGCWVLAAAILIFGNGEERQAFPILVRIHFILMLLSAAALAAAGYFRLKGKLPFFGCHGIVALFFAAHMVMRYQAWSGHPQMMDYTFSLLGCVAMAIYAYQMAAFEAGIGSLKVLTGAGLLGCFFCFASLPCGEYIPIYAAGAIWMASNLSGLQEAEKPQET